MINNSKLYINRINNYTEYASLYTNNKTNEISTNEILNDIQTKYYSYEYYGVRYITKFKTEKYNRFINK